METHLRLSPLLQQFGHIALYDEPPVGQYGHAVADLLHFVQQVAGQDDGASFTDKIANQFPHLGHARRVHAVGRLVQHQQFRVSNERVGQPQSLLHSQRVGLELVASSPAEAHLLQHFVYLAGMAAP